MFRRISLLSLFLALTLSACNGVAIVPLENTPAPAVTLLAPPTTVPPTATSLPPTAIPQPATSTPAASSGCVNAAEYVADVTIPDGSVLESDAPFAKTWRVKNTGTCSWDSRYALAFVDGTLFSAYDAFALSVSAAPGQTVDVSIPMRAPIYPGAYLSAWKFRAPDGSLFGVGRNNSPLTVKLSIGGGADVTVIAGFVYQDLNGNLQYDSASDELMANRTVQVQQGRCGASGSLLASALSGADGRYTLTGNFSGAVCVSLLGEAIIEHIVDLTLPAGGSYNPLDLRAALPSAAISGYVWNDADGDGLRQNIEPVFAGVTVILQKGACGSNSVPVSVLSDANGFFQFRELYAGTYCVSLRASDGNNAAILGSGAWTTSAAQQINTLPVHESFANFGWKTP
jgi:hypothetical protein